MSIPEAGRWIGLGRESAYQAAQKGDIKTIKVGGRFFVPTAWLAARLGLDPQPLTRADIVPQRTNDAS